MLLVLCVFMAAAFIPGCTGGVEYRYQSDDPAPPPPPPPPPPGPTGTPTFETGKDLVEFVTGRTNIFNISLWGSDNIYPYANSSAGTYTGQDVYWVESVGNPNGRVAVLSNSRVGDDVVTGLNVPQAFALHRRNGTNYLFVAESGGGSGGSLYRYDLSTNPPTATTLASGLQGEVYYMALDNPESLDPWLYYAVDAGGTSSVLARVVSHSTNPVPQVISTSLSNVHHVYVYSQFIPQGAVDPDTGDDVSVQPNASDFVFVTEDLGTPNGKVLMFNVSNWNGTAPLTPVEINSGNGQNRPAKITFVPDIKEYLVNGESRYGHTDNTGGTIFWTNYASNTGEVWGARLEINGSGTNMEVTDGPKKIAESLRMSYDIIGPDDFRYLFTTFNGNTPTHVSGNKYDVWADYVANGNELFNRLYVSRNEARGDGGNYYVIDLNAYNDSPLTPGNGVSNFITENAQFPLNGKMQVYLYDPDDGSIPQAYRMDLFFTGMERDTGSNNTYIYIFKNKFSPPGS